MTLSYTAAHALWRAVMPARSAHRRIASPSATPPRDPASAARRTGNFGNFRSPFTRSAA